MKYLITKWFIAIAITFCCFQNTVGQTATEVNCPNGQVKLLLSTYGGSALNEKWVDITTLANGEGEVIWAQGNGSYGDQQGLVTNQAFCVELFTTYYINAYDRYDDAWDGTKYVIKTIDGKIVANNNGLSPNDNNDEDNTYVWENKAIELESSEAFFLPLPLEVETSNLSSNSVQFSWENPNNPNPTEYQYVYAEADQDITNAETISLGTTNQITLTNLEAYTDYVIKIRAIYGTNTGQWRVLTFKTEPLCPHIENLNVLNIAATTAELSWDNIPTASFQYAIGEPNFDPNTATIETTTEHSVTLSNLEASHDYEVYVRSSCNGDLGIWSEAVSFTTTPASCNTISSFQINGLTETTASFTWDNVTDIIRYEIVYGNNNFDHLSATPIEIPASTNNYIISGLESSSTYQAYIRTVCDEGNGAWLGPETFTTVCENISNYPYLENFNDAWSCWTVIDVNNDNKTWKSQEINGVKAAVSLNNSNDYLISPRLNVNSSLICSWKERSTNANTTFDCKYVVKISTLGPNPSEFQAIDTIVFSHITWEERILDLHEYEGQLIYIAFQAIATEFPVSNIALDDFKVSPTPTCYIPTELEVDTQNLTSVELSWNGWSDNQFEIEYGEIGFTPSQTPNITNISESHCTIDNLQQNTSYEIYIRSRCSSSNTSDWAGPFEVQTACGEVSDFPYTENFNTSWNCWTIINADNDNLTWRKSNQYFGMPASNLTAYGAGNGDDYLITPQLNISDNLLEARWSDRVEDAEHPNTYEVRISTTGTDIEDFTDVISTITCTNEDWEEHFISLEAYKNQHIYIAFHQTFSNSSAFAFGIDDFKVKALEGCTPPLNPSISNITTTSAEVHWLAGTATTWDIAYGLTGFDFNEQATVSNLNTNSYTISNLEHSSIYDVYLRANCGTTPTEWVGPIQLQTSCEAVSSLPYSEDFELANAPHLPTCWNKIETGTGKVSVWSSTNANLKYLYLERNNDEDTLIAVSPQLEGIGEHNKIIKFKFKGSIKLEVGTMNDPTDKNGFVPYDTISTSATWVNIQLELGADFNASGNYFAIRLLDTPGFGAGFGEIDNFEYEMMPTCPAPTDFHKVSYTPNSIIVDWNSSDVTTWDFKVVELTAAEPLEATHTNISNKPATISGLEMNHTYKVWMRNSCGDNDKSEWVGPISVSTANSNCPRPSYLMADATVESATLSWDGFGGDVFDVEFRTIEEAFQNTATHSNINGNSLVINDLQHSTTYQFRVRNVCDNNSSLWSSTKVFTTPCGAFEAPFEEDFVEFLPQCWTKRTGVLSDNTILGEETYPSWVHGKFRNTGNNKAARLNIHGDNTSAWLISPAIDLGAGNKMLEFDLAMTDNYYTSISEQTGSDDKFGVIISTDSGQTWSSSNIARMWDNANSPYIFDEIAYEGQHVIIPLDNFTGIVKIAFYGESTVLGNGNNDLFIDNIKLSEAPSCMPISLVSANNIYNTSAEINWIEETDKVDIKLVKVSDNTETIIENITDKPYTLNNLEAESDYEVWVRRNCSSDDQTEVSIWSPDALTFRTLSNCPAPDDINITPTVTSAEVSWNGYFASQWDLEWVAHGETPTGTPSVSNTTTTNYTITGLSEQSEYDLYIRTVCDGGNTSHWTQAFAFTTLNNQNDILSFNIANNVQVGNATIDNTAHTVLVQVAYQTDLSALTAIFTLSDHAQATVNGALQVSGTSTNDFSSAVTYVVTAEDGSVQNWTVTVEALPASNTADILAYSINGQLSCSIDAENHSISVTMPWDSNLGSLVANFILSNNASAKVGDINQYSGSTANAFYNDVTYTVTSESGTTQDWVVSVTKSTIPQGATCNNPIPLVLNAYNISGTTDGFGNTYNYSQNNVDVLAGNDIVYQFTVSEEYGRISSNIDFSDSYGSISIFNGVPGNPNTECIVHRECYYTNTFSGFSDIEIEGGSYYLMVSRVNTNNQGNINFEFDLTYEAILHSESQILSYNIEGQVGTSEINTEARKVKVIMPYGSDLSQLKASFTLSEGASAKVNGVAQVSGETENNWATANGGYITYTIIAEDGVSISGWKVYVNTVPNTENDILSYSIPGEISPAVINTDEHKVTVTMPYSASLNNLVANFTLSDEATAQVNGVEQISGESAHNWNAHNPIEYLVKSGNNNYQTWKVYVEKALNNQAEILEFKLLPTVQVGETVFDNENPTSITIDVRPNAVEDLFVIYKLTLSEGATATYEGNPIVVQATALNNMENIIVVTAEDGTQKEWNVLINILDGVDMLDASSLNVYPNPTKGIVNIKSDLDKNEWTSIEVINSSGQVIKQIAKEDINSNIDLSSQANGLYLIRINTTKGRIVKKINLIK